MKKYVVLILIIVLNLNITAYNKTKLIDALNRLGYYIKTEDALEKELKDYMNKNDLDISSEEELEEVIYKELEKKTIKDTNDILMLVNKENLLPKNYLPNDLVKPEVKSFGYNQMISERIQKDLKDMFSSAKEEDIDLATISNFRSYEYQQELFDRYAKQNGVDEANKFSARAGQSEHQTGLVVDVSTKSLNYALSTDFENTEAGKWIKENAHKYGFIIRYPKGKEEITGYQFEPWHLRYVGRQNALEIYNKDIVLEEYLNEIKKEKKQEDKKRQKQNYNTSTLTYYYRIYIKGTINR